MKQILAVGLGREALAAVEPFLDRVTFGVDRMARADSALVVVTQAAFDLIIVSHPLPGVSLPEFLAVVRRPGSPNERTRIIVVGEAGRLDEVRGLLRPLDLVLGAGQTQPLLDAASSILDSPLRMAARFFVRLEIELRSGRELLACQTENVSESGMFLRTNRMYPVGTLLAFQFTLPNDRTPLQGEAEVVRQQQGEGVTQGIGVRFAALRGDDRTRLVEYLRRHAASRA